MFIRRYANALNAANSSTVMRPLWYTTLKNWHSFSCGFGHIQGHVYMSKLSLLEISLAESPRHCGRLPQRWITKVTWQPTTVTSSYLSPSICPIYRVSTTMQRRQFSWVRKKKKRKKVKASIIIRKECPGWWGVSRRLGWEIPSTGSHFAEMALNIGLQNDSSNTPRYFGNWRYD